MESELSTVLVTPKHLIYAEIETAGRRLLDMVNDTHTDFLRVRRAAVYRRECHSVVANASNLVVQKHCLALIAPATGQHEAPQKRCDNFISKKKFEAFLIVLGYEVYGKLYLRGADDPVAALTNELAEFFPVPKAEVCFRGMRGSSGVLPVVIVNSAFVSLFRIGDFTRPTANPSVPLSGKSKPTPVTTPSLSDK